MLCWDEFWCWDEVWERGQRVWGLGEDPVALWDGPAGWPTLCGRRVHNCLKRQACSTVSRTWGRRGALRMPCVMVIADYASMYSSSV